MLCRDVTLFFSALIFALNFGISLSYIIRGGKDEDLVVSTKNGKVKGQYMYTFGGRKVRGFLSIPYAKPPVGDLRFKPPQAAENWSGIKDATYLHPACIQTMFGSPVIGEEDCLYLNVFTPLPSKKSNSTKTTSYPVMFWLHGGDWNYHYGGFYSYNPRFLLDHDVILVSINYRLGALGFLTTGDLEVPGNNGLKDQSFALRWVQENIRNFGGDPKKVTLFGLSAGGASVRFQMFSPLSKGLFHAAISHSGTELCNWSLTTREDGIRYAKKLASNCNCPTNDTAAMVECLRNVEAHKIVQITAKYESYNIVPITYLFKPVIEVPHEGAFLDDYPWNILKQGRCSDVPNINGVTHDEGAINIVPMNLNRKMYEDMEYNFERMIPYSVIFDVDVSRSKEIDLSEEIRQFYFKSDTMNNTKLQNLLDVFTDTTFFVCAVESTKLSLKYAKQPTYFYLFDYRGEHSMTETFGDPIGNYGVSHADDELYLFDHNHGYKYKRQSDQDFLMMDWFTKTWTDFATYRNPTPLKSSWKPVKSEKVEYLHIKNYTGNKMKSNLWKERLDFWYDLCDRYNCKYKVSDL